MRIPFEVFDNVLDPPDGKTLIQRHLNFDVRFTVANNIVTHKCMWFHTEQIHPSVSKCCKGECLLELCQAKNDFTSTEDQYDPKHDGSDPLIGKLVKISAMGEVSFHDPDGHEEELDLNWKRLRTMAQPVVDEQLAKLAMAGKWKKHPIRLQLGTLLLDNTTIRFDKESYKEMAHDRKEDLEQCEVAWGRKLDCELKKRGLTKAKGKPVKYTKYCTEFVIDTSGDKENNGMNEGMREKRIETTVKKEEMPEEVSKDMALAEVPFEKEEVCEYCGEKPCVWVAKKHDMVFYDLNEHAHLPEEDLPPNNIRRKKLYRQMTLHIQEGHVRKGVRHELPTCVEIGTRELFPSPTFMGFRST
jgi:hypothetical protein